MAGECVFCRVDLRRITAEEHIFPKWLLGPGRPAEAIAKKLEHDDPRRFVSPATMGDGHGAVLHRRSIPTPT